MQQKLNESDTLLQQTSIVSGIRRPNSAGKFRSGSSTLIPSEKVTAEELLSGFKDSALLKE